MPDNTPQNGTASVAGDGVTTVNGVSITEAQVQRMKLDAGGVNGAHTDVGPDNPLPTQLSGITFRLSTANSSSVNLAAAATFTGTIESAFNQPAAQVMVFSDQPFTAHVDQFNDQSNLISTDTFVRFAGQSLNENVQVNGDFLRVRVVNNGAATTTGLSIETTYGPLPPLPRALSSLGNLKVVNNENGIISTANTSLTTNLAAGGVYTGAWEEVSEYSMVVISIYSSHASATNGLSIQMSMDGVNPDLGDSYTIPAATGKTFSFAISARFFRVVFTNGATATTALRIQTLLSKTIKKSSSQRPQDNRSNDNDMEEHIAYLMGYDSTLNDWSRLRASWAGGLHVDTSPDKVALFKGRASTFRMVGKAGTTARRYLAVFNAAGSGRNFHLNALFIDFAQTAQMAITVIPPMIRVYRISAAPAGGTALVKIAKDSNQSSIAGITVLGDASADNTNSATALSATTTAGQIMTQEFFPRLITGAGYEVADRIDLMDGRGLLIRPGEGFVLGSDITLATQEPASVNIIATVDWYETAV